MKRQHFTSFAYIVTIIFVFSSPDARAMKTGEVEFGRDGAYDGAVSIARDPDGRLLFRDAQVTSPTTLFALQTGAQSHSALADLAADDHPHYFTSPRHAAAHDAAFNAALPVPPDPAGHVTLGDHLNDADLHLRRDAAAVPCHFAVPYESGSVVTRLRVLWKGQGSGDGVKIRLVKRDVASAVPSWTVVGTQGTFTGTTATTSVHDIPDETLADGYAYSIEITSVVAAAAAELHAVGVETSKRVY